MGLPSNAIIEAYAETYTEADILTVQTAAVQAHAQNLPRMEINQVALEGGNGTAQWVEGNPEDVMEICRAVLRKMRSGSGKKVNDSIAHADFSNRPVGW